MPKRPARAPATGPALTSHIALERIRNEWTPFFMETYPDEVDAAEEDWKWAMLGRAPFAKKDFEIIEDARTSLPEMWAAFFRPRPGGGCGLDEAARWRRFEAPVLRAGVARLARARGVYLECLHIDRRQRLLIGRDLFDGHIYRIAQVDAPLLKKGCRWLRFCGLLVEVGDGTWGYISSFLGAGALAELTPEELLGTARAALTARGIDAAEIDPAAPHGGLARWAGIAFATVARWLRERPEPVPQPTYITNSEGERAELQEAQLALSPAAGARVAAALRRAPDFQQSGSRSWAWIDENLKEIHPRGEVLADLEEVEEDLWEVTANSPGRLERLRARLWELCGEAPTVTVTKVVRPWEVQEHCVAEPGEGVRVIKMGSAFEHGTVAQARQELGQYILEQIRGTLDRDVEALGGTPREVARRDGEAVEGWLRLQEKGGIPGEAPASFLDLDPLREELGLPTVRSQHEAPGEAVHLRR